MRNCELTGQDVKRLICAIERTFVEDKVEVDLTSGHYEIILKGY